MRFKEWLLLSEKIEVNGVQFRDKLDALKYIYTNYPNPENLVVSYTLINKIGINPKSQYKTPLGIYFYPLKYVIAMNLEVPFAGYQPYINVCEIVRPNKILHMQEPTEPQLGIDLLMKTFSETEVENAIAQINTKGLDIRSNYSTVWLATQLLANENPILWNTNLRKLGIDGFIDHDTGTIHTVEPTQGVVFTANALKVIHVIENKENKENKEKYMPSVEDLIKNVKNKDEWAKSFIKKQILSNDDISTIMGHVANKNEMAKIIIQNKKELSSDNVFYLLHYASDKQEIANLLDSENINKLSSEAVNKLLINASDKQEMAKIIIQNKNKLFGDDVDRLLNNASDKQEIANLLGSENINKLSSEAVNKLLVNASDKQEMAKIIIQNKKELSDINISHLINHASDKKEIAKTIIQNKKELSNIAILELISSASDKQEMAKILIQNEKELSAINVFALLRQASNKQEMAKILGSENINKLSDNKILLLLRLENKKQEMAKIIDQYYTKKTPRIQAEIQPYL